MDGPLVCRGVDGHVAFAVHRGTGGRGIVFAGAGSRPCLPLSDHSDRTHCWSRPSCWGTYGISGWPAWPAIYLIFLLAQTRGTWRAFWESSAATEREKMLGSAERRRAEAERASLAAAVEQTAEEILITDAEGNIQYCNPAFERLTGYSRSEVIGRNPRFLKSDEHDAQFYRDLWSTIAGGGIWAGRFTNRKKDGIALSRGRYDFADPRRLGESDRLCFGDPRRDRPAPHGRPVAAGAKNGRDRPVGGRRGARFQ